jgi:non-canonical (house-cleaning) NTP pyrophosphatase
MATDLRDFWHDFQSGVEVAVHGAVSDRLLGVRDGFLRFFHDGLERPVPVAVVAQQGEEPRHGLPMSDAETIAQARAGAQALLQRLGRQYHFYACSEGGLHAVDFAGQTHYFVRSWTVIVGAAGEAWGSGGSVELPERLIAGLVGEQIGTSVPGTRRAGGLISSLTGGLESRRSAVGLATLHALSTLFYGLLESRPIRRR